MSTPKPASTGSVARPSRCGGIRALGQRAGPGHPAPAAEHPLAGQHEQAERDQHQRERARGWHAERHGELGEDLGGERLVAEDLERAVLGQQHQGHQQAAAQDRAAGLAQRDPDERAHAPDAEAAGHLLLARVGGAQAGRDRQVDQRVHGERHHHDRTAEAVHPGPQRRPAEADHEVGDGQRHHDQHRPDPPAGQVGALDAPGRGGADDRAQPIVTTTVSRTVFHSRSAVRRRKISWVTSRCPRRAPRSAGTPAAARASRPRRR